MVEFAIFYDVVDVLDLAIAYDDCAILKEVVVFIQGGVNELIEAVIATGAHTDVYD